MLKFILLHKNIIVVASIIFFVLILFSYVNKPSINSLANIEKGITKLNSSQEKLNNEITSIKQDIRLLAKSDSIMNEQLRFYPAAVPVTGNITSFYQIRKGPINGIPTFHTGVDIRAPKGTAVLATGDGRIDKTSNDYGNYGKTIIIDHQNGFHSLYGHLSNILVAENQLVKRGQEIGKVGSTGRSTGNHLHYEISFREKKINPGVFRIPYRRTAFLQTEYNIYHLL
jgi:murein DD-endopeptidase MepM/ murein hydrolase activator NlpD